MKSHRSLFTLLFALPAFATALLASRPAAAQEFATPPPGRSSSYIVRDYDDSYSSYGLVPRSVVRFNVGPAGRISSEGFSPGLLVAIDFGRGPAGFRLTGAWLDVGTEHGLSQYTGELTIDFGGRSRLRPTVGAGAGVGRTSSSVNKDGSANADDGAWLGLGVVRAGLGVMLPLDEVDARLGLDFTGTFPAIRAENAPPVSPWLLAGVNVSVGF